MLQLLSHAEEELRGAASQHGRRDVVASSSGPQASVWEPDKESSEVLSQDQLAGLRDALLSAQPLDPADDLTPLVPKRIGVYTWSTTEDSRVVYVGKATGRRGLHRRVVREHLNPRYLLTDQRKWSREKDAYQIAHHALVNGKPAIDKSAFRKNIGRMHRLSPGQETVDFIRSRFVLRFVLVPTERAAVELERRVRSELLPRYNIQ